MSLIGLIKFQTFVVIYDLSSVLAGMVFSGQCNPITKVQLCIVLRLLKLYDLCWYTCSSEYAWQKLFKTVWIYIHSIALSDIFHIDKYLLQVARLLMDTTVSQFYPTLFILVIEVLDMLGDLVWERIMRKAEYSDNGILLHSLPGHYAFSFCNLSRRFFFWEVVAVISRKSSLRWGKFSTNKTFSV